jgi:hypothetical protein
MVLYGVCRDKIVYQYIDGITRSSKKEERMKSNITQ